MTKIRITRGAYGLYVNNSVVSKTSKDEPFDVSYDEAKRLVDLEVAEIVDIGSTGGNVEQKDENGNPVYNKSMNMATLSKIALQYGVDKSALAECRTKQQIIDLIDAKKDEESGSDDDDDDDTDTDTDTDNDTDDDGEQPNFNNGDGVVG